MSSDGELERLLASLGGHLGAQVRAERRRRRWTQRDLATRAGISSSLVHWLESGNVGRAESYARLGRALGFRLEIELVDGRRSRGVTPSEDPVHAAMGDWFAGRLRNPGVTVAVDEPYQHYQFAGRADVLAWKTDRLALLHVENRTRFPNLQEALGSYNAKRQYLPSVLSDRLGLRHGFDSVTHVMAVLWSSEALHAVRVRESSFEAVCPDPVEALQCWLEGKQPPSGTFSSLVFLDPAASGRSCPLAAFADARRVRGRWSDYRDALEALKAARRC